MGSPIISPRISSRLHQRRYRVRTDSLYRILMAIPRHSWRQQADTRTKLAKVVIEDHGII